MNQPILDGNIDMFRFFKFEPSALKNGCVPVDIDVSPFDNSGSHKAGVFRTYKNFDGNAPIFACIGTEGYLCNAKLREGKQHCQSGMPVFLSETIAAAKQMTKFPLLFRMDSGNDAPENMLLLHWNDPQLKFLIKHNFRREDRYAIAEELKSVCQNVQHFLRAQPLVTFDVQCKNFLADPSVFNISAGIFAVTELVVSAPIDLQEPTKCSHSVFMTQRMDGDQSLPECGVNIAMAFLG